MLQLFEKRYQENPHPENSTQKIPTWNILTHVFKYSHPRF